MLKHGKELSPLKTGCAHTHIFTISKLCVYVQSFQRKTVQNIVSGFGLLRFNIIWGSVSPRLGPVCILWALLAADCWEREREQIQINGDTQWGWSGDHYIWYWSHQLLSQNRADILIQIQRKQEIGHYLGSSQDHWSQTAGFIERAEHLRLKLREERKI